jgi:adenylate cyclase
MGYPRLALMKRRIAVIFADWMWPVAVTLVCLIAVGVGGVLYFSKLKSAAPAPAPQAKTTVTPAPPAYPPPISLTEKFTAETVPFVSDRVRTELSNEYIPAVDHKALALSINGINHFVTGQPSEEAAKDAALEQCQKRVEAGGFTRKCELYAVGNTTVYPHEKPPVPPPPWISHDPSTERPFASKDMPLLRDAAKTRLEANYVPGKKTKSIAVGPGGQFFFNVGYEAIEESARRNLEGCGAVAGVPCMIVAVDDVFVVPVPTTLRVLGFFKAAGHSGIAAEVRDDVARKLADASSGWNAVAVGAAGRPGLGLKAASERAAVNAALRECVKRDSDCQIIAIGPFSVGPN